MIGWVAWAVGTASAADGPPAIDCGTMRMLPHAPPVGAGAPLPELRALGGKVPRDVYGVPNLRTSANFAVRYGNVGGVSAAEADALLDAFEEVWALQVDELGHPAPYSTGQFLFNVYIGDTGGGAPSGLGNAGYYYVDDDYYPMIVVAADSLFDTQYAAATAYHEFYHAIQGSLNRYDYDGVSAWYWEATAEWSAVEVAPLNPWNGGFVFSYLLLPELPVNAFDYPDTGVIEEYYQYGAFLFPHDLSRQLGRELIRDSWLDTGSEPDPIEVLRDLAADEGADLDDLWLDHLAHNAAYDYDAGELYRATTEFYAPYYPQNQALLDSVSGAGGSGSAAEDLAPRRYGSGTVRLAAPVAGTLEVRVTGRAAGSAGSPALYGARVVRVTGGDIEYLDVPFVGAEGSLDVEDVGDEDEVFLAVGAWTPDWDRDLWLTERFPFDWSLTVIPQDPTEPTTTGDDDDDDGPDGDDDDDDGGDDKPDFELPEECGCSSAGASPAGWLVLGGLIALAARRRR